MGIKVIKVVWENKEEFERLAKELDEASERFNEALLNMQAYEASVTAEPKRSQNHE